ncbi:MAG: class I SAM-dependent methyltransferase [Actinomycetes bacterium]
MPRRPAIRTSTDEWRTIAATAESDDLLYHICSRPDKRGSWTEHDFYASGREDWADFLRHWQHYEPDVGGRCVEIGCGAGRMTAALAQFFTSVAAVDVSDVMIERARAHTPDTVTFGRVDGSELPLPDASADAVFTVHVLQHLDSEAAIRQYVNEAFRVLRPGGTIMVHIRFVADPPSWRARLRAQIDLARSRRALARRGEAGAVRMTMPSVGASWRMLTVAGFRDVELRAFPVQSNGFVHTFYFARRPLADPAKEMR